MKVWVALKEGKKQIDLLSKATGTYFLELSSYHT